MKKSIEITPSDLLAAVNEVTKREEMQKLNDATPIMSLLLTTFGALLVNVLFNEKGGQKSE